MKTLAKYIVRFLIRRNGAELEPVFDNMTVSSRRRLIGELGMILQHGGKPPNWIDRDGEQDDDLDEDDDNDEDESDPTYDELRKNFERAQENIRANADATVKRLEEIAADRKRDLEHQRRAGEVAADKIEKLRSTNVALYARQQELLQVIARISQTTPFPEEMEGWEGQRAKLLAEVGTLKAAVAENNRATAEAIRLANNVLSETQTGPSVFGSLGWWREAAQELARTVQHCQDGALSAPLAIGQPGIRYMDSTTGRWFVSDGERWVPEGDPKISREHPSEAMKHLGLAYQSVRRLIEDATKREDHAGAEAWDEGLKAIVAAEEALRVARGKQAW